MKKALRILAILLLAAPAVIVWGKRIGCSSEHPADNSPDAEKIQSFQANFPTDAIWDKPLCENQGKPKTTCRDPIKYWRTNEPEQFLWLPYIKNLGGAFLGVGSDQNYSLIAAAKSDWVWLIDYDPIVVQLHHILRALIIASASPREFLDKLKEAERADARRIIREEYQGEEELGDYLLLFNTLAVPMEKYYGARIRDAAQPNFDWLQSPENYSFIRNLFRQNKIKILPGDLLGGSTISGIAAAARKLDVPLRLIYLSNCLEFWEKIPEEYRANIKRLPLDGSTVALMTIGPKTGFVQKGRWHYIAQKGLLHQELMEQNNIDSAKNLAAEKSKAQGEKLSLSGWGE
jgi:hypothetical protein